MGPADDFPASFVDQPVMEGAEQDEVAEACCVLAPLQECRDEAPVGREARMMTPQSSGCVGLDRLGDIRMQRAKAAVERRDSR